MKQLNLKRIAVSATVLALLVAGAALADRTITLLSAPASIYSMRFVPQTGGAVAAEVCGRTQQTDGGVTQVTCYSVTLPSGHAISVAVNGLATGQALTFWRTQENLP